METAPEGLTAYLVLLHVWRLLEVRISHTAPLATPLTTASRAMEFRRRTATTLWL